ncbi:hypothetical protein [Aliarcobacter cryaerophilus]|uniref:hypothetical protein n=1 Tax=Aliarcobacter cryaerophilus TaxID=28198 RepID=UPI0021B622E2|nr:hypothetical protein [Aliarcobacter cryaerophilus]MCT7530425.1 hypothetical protein [Aliarcobacter cryaerophilus]
MKPLYNNIKGISFIRNTNKWRAYINEQHIGNFDTRIEAVSARLQVEEIFKNVVTKLDVKSFNFNRDGDYISIELAINTAEDIFIKTNILYPNSRKRLTKGEVK